MTALAKDAKIIEMNHNFNFSKDNFLALGHFVRQDFFLQTIG
jgi:hypothetical protein